MTDEIQATQAAASLASEIAAIPDIESAPAKPADPPVGTAGTARAEFNVLPDIPHPSPRTETTGEAAATTRITEAPGRGNRFAVLAASVALAAAGGAVVGTLGASGFTRSAPPVDQTEVATGAVEKAGALQSTINRMQTELVALRTSVESGTRATNGQFSKLIKAMESLERVERRAEASPPREVTGSVSAPQPVATTPAQSPQPRQATQPPQPPIVEGWVVRNVYRGTAIIQNRRIGTVDVEPGDILQGVGRIESIKKQDGRWVVVTSKGLITSIR
jgi:hypothetical protein